MRGRQIASLEPPERLQAMAGLPVGPVRTILKMQLREAVAPTLRQERAKP